MILVFGGGGQLGLELARLAGGRTALTALPREAADIAEPSSVAAAMDAARPNLVVNAAAFNDVDGAERDPAPARRGNVDGPATLAAACEARGIPFIHVSTDYVFDGAAGRPYREDDPVRPLSAYGRSKADGEEAVRRAAGRHLVIRTAWLFSRHRSNFLKSMLKFAGERDELRIVADQRGSPTSAADLAAAILAIAPRLGDGFHGWGTYHFAGTGAPTRFEWVERIVAAQQPFTGRAPKLTPIASGEFPTPAKRPLYSVLDCSRFANTFGIAPQRWETAVDDTVRDLLGP